MPRRRPHFRRLHSQQRHLVSIIFLATSLLLLCGLGNGCKQAPSQPGLQQHVEPGYAQIERDLTHGHLRLAESEAHAVNSRLGTVDDEKSWKFRILEARIDVLEGKNQDALRLLGGSLPAHFATADPEIEREMLQALAYARLGQRPIADATLEKAQEKCRRTHSGMQAELYSIRGILAEDNDDSSTADALFHNAIGLARERKDVFLESTILLNLGWVALLREHYDEALHWSQAATTAAQGIGAELVLEKALANVGWAYYGLGDFAKSLANFEQAEAQAEKLGATSDRVRWLNTSGDAQYRMGDLKQAENLYRRSLSLAETLQNREEIVEAETDLAFLSFQQKNYGQAARQCARALELANAVGSKSLEADPMFLKGLLLNHSDNRQRAASILLQLEASSYTSPSLHWQVENALAKHYGATLDEPRAERWYRKSIETFERQRSSLEDDESKLPFSTNADTLYRDFAAYLIAQNRSGEALALLDLGRARTLEEGVGLRARNSGATPLLLLNQQSIARRLDAAILFYSLGPEKSYLWAITRGKTRLFELPREPEIEGHVRNYQRAVLRSNDPVNAGNEDGAYLYRVLIAPAQSLIPANGRVFLVPDGCLNGLNFETILRPAAGGALGAMHYWIEDVTLTTAPSLRLLAAFQPKVLRGQKQKILLIGNPLSPSDDYPSLPNASLEVADIEKHFATKNRLSITQAEAVPKAYAANRPGDYTYIHFVAHGTASRLSPLDSAVVLSSAPRQPDDFKLYARDIARQRIHAELVTISSCYGSGTRIYAGEGMVGLSWAFLRAGSHNVIASLWDVSDASTPLLMDRMYGELQTGSSPAAALRTAKLALLHSSGSFRKPLYWAPFQVYAGAFAPRN